ncbi:uncharacterized protein LOC132061966 [Lycium ferocissimum]|uniref:uncharacterized protein LOC132061966 n=1 Tax=Lycium ferocissimum TaxID=112874 RepID=UPI0028165016|nr:uncharacterized protein LOC132061966 [Lycium ferocissimum]
MGVRVYVELKRENRVLGMYPMCVSIHDFDVEDDATGNRIIGDDVLQIGYSENRDDKETLKIVMTKYAIRERFNFKTERSNAISYTAACWSPECKWKFRASRIGDSEMFRVRFFDDEHTCPLKDKVYSQRQATSWFIGEAIVKAKITNHKRKVTPGDIKDDVKNEFGVDVSYMMAWRAREKAIKDFRENEFMYLFVALKAFVKGFECCRPIVVVDGAHLKSTYNGTFVSASTLDGAGNILPLAYGVIDSENNKSWTWFFELFKQAYGVRKNMCVVSDRHESIIHAVSKVYPTVPHLACIWHLWKNVTKQYTTNGEVLSPIFYSRRRHTADEFDKLMEKIGNVDIRVKRYLKDLEGINDLGFIHLLTEDGQ